MFPWFISNTLAAAGLALVVFLMCRFGRFRPAVQHALWLVVLVKLLTPAWLAWPWSPWDLFDHPVAVETASPPMDELVVDAATPAPTPAEARLTLPTPSETVPPHEPKLATALPQDTSDGLRTAVEANKGKQAAHASQLVRELAPAEPWMSVFARWFWQTTHWLSLATLYLWAVGAAVLLLVQTAQALRFRRLIARGEPISGELADELGRLAVRMRVSLPPARRVPDLVSPVLWCLGKPTLLWPSTLEQSLVSNATRSLLLHELAHLRRRDHWVAWLEGLALLVWWWNPLFWYVRRRLRQCAEMACDAWVIWALPDARRTYAESLVAVTELASQGRAVVPAWGAIGEARNLERRLTMIFRNDVRRELSWSGLVVILLLALVVLPGWSWGQAEEKAEPAEPQAAGSLIEPAAVNPPTTEPAVPSGMPGIPISAPASEPPSAATNYATPVDAPPLSPANVPATTPPGQPQLPATATPRPLSPPRMGAGVPGATGDMSYAIQPSRPAMPMVPGARRATGPDVGPMSIRAFTLKGRDPAEMIPMIDALWELSADQIAVIAFVPHGEGAMPPGQRQAPLTYAPAEPPGAPGLPGRSASVANQPGAFGAATSEMFGAAPPAPRLAADSPTKSLIVRGSAQQIERVAQLVAALDTPEQTLSEQVEKLGDVRGLTPQHRSLDEIVNVLQSLGIPVRAVIVRIADEKPGRPGGSLIAIGPENDVAEIQQLVQSLDVEQGKLGIETDSRLRPTLAPPQR